MHVNMTSDESLKIKPQVKKAVMKKVDSSISKATSGVRINKANEDHEAPKKKSKKGGGQ
jgi:hypothetical protein